MFHYAAYNESGRRIDSSYQKGQPARTRMGIQGLIPGEAPPHCHCSRFALRRRSVQQNQLGLLLAAGFLSMLR